MRHTFILGNETAYDRLKLVVTGMYDKVDYGDVRKKGFLFPFLGRCCSLQALRFVWATATPCLVTWVESCSRTESGRILRVRGILCTGTIELE